jgi:hypothetical protein
LRWLRATTENYEHRRSITHPRLRNLASDQRRGPLWPLLGKQQLDGCAAVQCACHKQYQQHESHLNCTRSSVKPWCAPAACLCGLQACCEVLEQAVPRHYHFGRCRMLCLWQEGITGRIKLTCVRAILSKRRVTLCGRPDARGVAVWALCNRALLWGGTTRQHRSICGTPPPCVPQDVEVPPLDNTYGAAPRPTDNACRLLRSRAGLPLTTQHRRTGELLVMSGAPQRLTLPPRGKPARTCGLSRWLASAIQ